MTKWQTIKSKKEYKAVQNRIDELIDAPRTDSVHNELSLLSFLIEEYDTENYAMSDSPPAAVIRFIMEMKGIKQKELIPILGNKSTVSKVLNGATKLQLDMVHPLSKFLGIPPSSLIPRMVISEKKDDDIKQVAEGAVSYKKTKKRKSLK